MERRHIGGNADLGDRGGPCKPCYLVHITRLQSPASWASVGTWSRSITHCSRGDHRTANELELPQQHKPSSQGGLPGQWASHMGSRSCNYTLLLPKMSAHTLHYYERPP